MTIAGKFYKCHECRKTIQIGQEYNQEQASKKFFHKKCYKIRVEKPREKREERRRNARMLEQHILQRNICVLMVAIIASLFIINDGRLATIAVAFCCFVFYVVNYCRKKDETSKR